MDLAAATPAEVKLSSREDSIELRRRVIRKISLRLLPLLVVAYIFNYIDRTSVGFAALTMNQDLGFSATQFGRGAGILFVGYCFFEVPSNLALYRFGARRWLARIMVTWGLAASATAFITGPMSFYFMRFLLGVAEAGFFPGVAFYLSTWFPAQYRARALAWFILAIPVSSVLGGPMSGMLLQLNGLWGLKGWQWMFLVQGLPACLLGVLLYMWLSDRPKEATWLTSEERSELLAMLDEEKRDRPKKSLYAALKDPRVVLLAAIQFGFVMGSYGIGIWLPQIIKLHGFGNLKISFISAVPYVLASVGILIWAKVVDHTGKKILNLLLACLLSAAGLFVSGYFRSFTGAMIGITVAIVAVSAARSIFWTIPTSFLTGAGAAGGFAFI
ncbi:MAG TPA: MFS transporter, partial [Candidatus Eremiobacteraceae bacterium]|nr:MFS transporter [Candidatus Eremiobacteraceae bacterium]